MKKLMQITFLTILLLIISGCNNAFDSLNTPTKPKINESVEAVDFSSIRSIPDMTSIGFEWQKVNDPKVVGYNFYRTDLAKNSKSLRLVKAIDNRFATHYVDKDLEPGTKYAYQISSRLEDGTESATIGHYSHRRVHGGVISACIDTIGAVACFVALGARHMDESPARRLERFQKLGTIDLRVDYLRPGLGSYFQIRAEAVRVGSRVGNARIEFTAADGLLVSTGTGAYIMS